MCAVQEHDEQFDDRLAIATDPRCVPFTGTMSVDLYEGENAFYIDYVMADVQTYDAAGADSLLLALDCETASDNPFLGMLDVAAADHDTGEPKPEPKPEGPKRPVKVETDGAGGGINTAGLFAGLALVGAGAAAQSRRPARD